MVKYEIKERLSEEELHKQIFKLNKEYSGSTWKHKNGGKYYIYGATVINERNSAWWGFLYHPIVDNCIDKNVFYARPLDEYLDGRFTKIK